MEEFNNIELNDEELDNVVGGVITKTATFERLNDGHNTRILTIDVEEEGISRYHQRIHLPKWPDVVKAMNRYREQGYKIIEIDHVERAREAESFNESCRWLCW
ncbi:MAG: hypothetical protein IKN12_00020 [Selenomonadaceae bacterium]|nr:hypothetical protein [Selenomonadaceae bacterium]